MTTDVEELSDAEWAERAYERIRCRATVKGRHDPYPRQCRNSGEYHHGTGAYYCRVHKP